MHDEHFLPMGGNTGGPTEELAVANTSVADYVWLPLRFADGRVYIDWLDEWRVEDFD
jgi:hypothetical protein